MTAVTLERTPPSGPLSFDVPPGEDVRLTVELMQLFLKHEDLLQSLKEVYQAGFAAGQRAEKRLAYKKEN